MALSESDRRRYARNIVLPEIGAAGQERLLQSRVLVVGAGGIGSPLLLYLAAAGVGTIGIVDSDKVDLSNLQRQILFETADVGRGKTESAADALLDLNPHIQIKQHAVRLTLENAKSILSEYDIVADGSDNFETRFLVHDTCFKLKKTLISAAVVGFNGQLSTFKAYLGAPHPCYHCFIPEAPPADIMPNCADNGVLGAAAGVIASMQALEVVKELLGVGNSLSGSVVVFDGLNAILRSTKLLRDTACPFCSTQA